MQKEMGYGYIDINYVNLFYGSVWLVLFSGPVYEKKYLYIGKKYIL
jgi:hypothetical protein